MDRWGVKFLSGHKFILAPQRWHYCPLVSLSLSLGSSQAELYTPDLFRAAINVTHSLDDRFGLPRKAVMSQRDVPGLTRGAVLHLADLGIGMISIGVNAATSPPSLPRGRPFLWRDVDSGKEVLMVLHPGDINDSRATPHRLNILHQTLEPLHPTLSP
jgi:hypothetical protein